MRNSLTILLIALLTGATLSAQVKIGNNPQNINPSSILELESTDKVLVITRVTTTQMNAIVPSQGALCFNTDLQSVHYYDGSQWINIGGGGTGGPLTADAIVNSEPTIVITPTATGDNLEVAPQSIGTDQIRDGSITGTDLADGSIGPGKLQDFSITQEKLSENSVGAFALDNDSFGVSAFNNDAGYITAGDINIVSPDADNVLEDRPNGVFYNDQFLITAINQNTDAIALDNDQSAANEIQNPELNGTILGLSGTAGTVDLGPIISAGGSDDQNLTLSGNTIEIEDGNTIDLTSILATGGSDNQNLTLNGNTIEIEDGNTIDLSPILGVGGSDDQNLTLNGNTIEIEDGNTIDLSPILGTGGSDDQNLTLSGNTIEIEDGNTIDLTPILATAGTDDQTAAEVTYDPTTSGLIATDTQAAIDEIAATGSTDDQTAAEVTYDPTTSGLTATDTQAAIDEIAATGSTDDQTAVEVTYDPTTSGLTATDTQAAIDEIAAAGSTDDQTAAEVTYDPATSGLTATDTQAAIDEIAAAGSTDDQTAAEVTYDPATSGLTATDTQAAIDEIVAGGSDDQTAAEVTYDPATSGLTATDTQAAIDEIVAGTLANEQAIALDITTNQIDLLNNDATINSSVKLDGTTVTVFNNGTDDVIQLADEAVTLAKINQNGATDGQVLKWDDTTTSWVTADDIGLTELTDGNIFLGDATNTPREVTLSGDATIDNLGALTIADDAVTTDKIENATILAEDLNDMGATVDGQILKWNTTLNATTGGWEVGTNEPFTGEVNNVFFAAADGSPTDTQATTSTIDNGGFFWDSTRRFQTGALYLGLKANGNTDATSVIESNTQGHSKLIVAERLRQIDGGFALPIQLRNETNEPNTGTGILFNVNADGNPGKGVLAFQRGATESEGSFHFIISSSNEATAPTLAEKVFSIENDGDIRLIGGIDLGGLAGTNFGTSGQVLASGGFGNPVQWVTNSEVTDTDTNDALTDFNPISGYNVNVDNTSIEIVSDALQIRDNGVTSIKIADGAISGGAGGQILDNSITASDLQNDSVDNGEIRIDAVRSSEIQDGSIATADIGDAQVTVAKITPSVINGNILTTTGGAVVWAAPSSPIIAKGKVVAGGLVNQSSGLGIANTTAGVDEIDVTGLFSNDNYIIQLTVQGDYTIYVSSQTIGSFTVETRNRITGNLEDADFHFTLIE